MRTSIFSDLYIFRWFPFVNSTDSKPRLPILLITNYKTFTLTPGRDSAMLRPSRWPLELGPVRNMCQWGTLINFLSDLVVFGIMLDLINYSWRQIILWFVNDSLFCFGTILVMGQNQCNVLRFVYGNIYYILIFVYIYNSSVS